MSLLLAVVAACCLAREEAAAAEAAAEEAAEAEDPAEDTSATVQPVSVGIDSAPCTSCGKNFYLHDVPFPVWGLCRECSEEKYDEEWPSMGTCWCGGPKKARFETCEICYLDGCLDITEDSCEDSRFDDDDLGDDGSEFWDSD